MTNNDQGYYVKENFVNNDSSVEVVEKLDSTNTNYTYYEKYIGKDGTIILGASTQLKDNECGMIVPGNTRIGMWYYDKKYLENIEGIQELLNGLSLEEEPIKKIQEFNTDIYYRKHILPDLYTSSLVSMKSQYYSNGENTRYAVEKERTDGTKINLSFVYQTSNDFRKQLQNLYNSVVRIDELEHVMFDLCEISEEIRPKKDEPVEFNAGKFIKNMNKKRSKQSLNKHLEK